MLGRHVVDIIDRLVDAGVGVEVCAKLDAVCAAPLNKVVALEVVAAVEGHVFQEVGQSALVFVLLQRAYLLCNVEVGTVLRPVVVADEVSQSVAELANPHSSVHGYSHVGHLSPCLRTDEEQQGGNNISKFHKEILLR